MPNFVDLTGQRFERLMVISRAPNSSRTRWHCLCDCGNETTTTGRALQSGNTKSCGCYGREISKRSRRHGMRYTSIYIIWLSMRTRCNNPKSDSFGRYGGRGIKVCERWDSFENFYADMGDRPSPSHSLDRIDNNGNYEPSNVRWATNEEQMNNRRATKLLEFRGKTQSMAAWSRELGLPRGRVNQRMREGWSTEAALTTPGVK